MIVLKDCMFAPGRKHTFSLLLALLWLIPWVLTIPLFHVHALDRQETPFLPEAFLTHTVFTPDLPGEYFPRPAIHQRGMPGYQHALASHFPQYSEIAFSLFGEDDDTKRKIGNPPIDNDEFSFLIPSLLESVHSAIAELASLPFLLLAFSASSRAPPLILS
jgi:hypothetical protein